MKVVAGFDGPGMLGLNGWLFTKLLLAVLTVGATKVYVGGYLMGFEAGVGFGLNSKVDILAPANGFAATGSATFGC